MKKTIALFILATFISLNTKADQLAWLSKENALKATSYLRNQTNVILWCACCEGNNPKQLITITNVYYEKTGTEEYYHIMLEGQNANDQKINEELDLAYVHVNKDGMAVCLGLELGLECAPCTKPFPYTSNSINTNSNKSPFDGTYIDKYGDKIIIEEIDGGDGIKYTLTGTISTNCVNPGAVITSTANIFRINMNGADPNYNGPDFFYTDIIDKCNIDIEPVEYGKSVKVTIRNCKDSKCASDNGYGNVYTKK